jgi:hypothetical protein
MSDPQVTVMQASTGSTFWGPTAVGIKKARWATQTHPTCELTSICGAKGIRTPDLLSASWLYKAADLYRHPH